VRKRQACAVVGLTKTDRRDLAYLSKKLEIDELDLIRFLIREWAEKERLGERARRLLRKKYDELSSRGHLVARAIGRP
jgi:hypothetical protein